MFRNVLSVDWDFFFPVPPSTEYDWGHDETMSLALQEVLWLNRASTIIAHGEKLPDTSGDEVGFWDRFTFMDEVDVFIADSHMHMCDPRIIDRITFNVENFDAHHDAAFTKSGLESAYAGHIDCSNWLAWYAISGSKCGVVYPSWRDPDHVGHPHCAGVTQALDVPDKAYDLPFNTVFICKSPAWTPPWLDMKFEKLLYDLRQRLPRTDFLKIQDTSPRYWDMEQVNEQAERLKEVFDDANVRTDTRSRS